MRMKPCVPHTELDALLAKAKDHVMTKDELRAQRKSWVIGEMMLEHPEMTREEVERIYEQVSF